MICDSKGLDITDFSVSKQHSAAEKVVIIIPTYNEASVIEETISQIFNATELINTYNIHVLIFDSASTDNTQSIVTSLQKIYPKLHLQCENEKSGLGSAYLQAMTYTLTALNADIIFEFDADLSHQPKYIYPMLEMIKNCDCVVGSRYVKGGSIPKNWAAHRKLFSIVGNYIARSVLTPKYKDFTSGFRATRSQLLKKILPTSFLSNQYAYKLQLLWLLHKNNSQIREFPIEFIDREKGISKLPKNSIADSLRVLFTLRLLEFKQMTTPFFVSIISMFVQFFIYNLLRDYLPPYNASQIAALLALLNHFVLTNRCVLKQESLISPIFTARRLSTLAVYSITIIYLQGYWLKIGVAYFGNGKLQENILLALGIGIGTLLNYFIVGKAQKLKSC